MIRRIEFRPNLKDPAYPATEILVDGRDLVEIVSEVERPFAEAEGTPGLEGGYIGLEPEMVLPPSRHFWGVGGGRTDIYRCGGCGIGGCWDLSVVIEVDEETVRWSQFLQGHRGPWSKVHWDYAALGELVFDRKQYENALEQAARELRR